MTGKRLARLLHDTSRQLGRIEEHGEARWSRLSRPYRGEAAKLLGQLRETIAPPATKKGSVRKKR